MTEETQAEVSTETPTEINIVVEPIFCQDSRGNVYRYFKVQNSQFEGVIFTLTEVDIVQVEGEEDQFQANGKVLFEETMDFTSKQLLEDTVFGSVVRDVFNKIIEELHESGLALETEEEETTDE